MEISIGDYGRMVFEMMNGKGVLPDHWDSIKDEAKPLVEQLLALNEKMKPSPYEIVGLKDKAPDEYRAAQEAYQAAFSKYMASMNDDAVGAKYNALRKHADDMEKEFASEEYWLKKAAELGI